MRGEKAYIVGDWWLTQRRDGKAPGIWQIARYDPAARSVVYRSTKQRDLNAAKPIIHAHVERELAKQSQPPDTAKVIPLLATYIDECAAMIVNDAQSRSSLRAFIGFMQADPITPNATVAELTPEVFERFLRWRMGGHRYAVQGKDKVHEHASSGVGGETVQRNLDDVRAALNYAVSRGRLPYAPKVPNVPRKHRSRPRDQRLTVKQLGAIVGYARNDTEAHRWVMLMLATAARPDACLAFDPSTQDHGQLLDMHPPGWPRTKKVNAWVPAIEPLRTMLDEWKAAPHASAASRKRWWRTMRRALELPADVIPKTIRHSVATMLRAKGVPGAEVSGLLGHDDPEMRKTSLVYAKYDPAYLAKARRALTTIWNEVNREADRWSAVHLRTKPVRGRPITIDRKSKEPQNS